MTQKELELRIEPTSNTQAPTIFANFVYVSPHDSEVYVDFHLYDVNSAHRMAAQIEDGETVVRVHAPTVARMVMSRGLAHTLARLIRDVVPEPQDEQA